MSTCHNVLAYGDVFICSNCNLELDLFNDNGGYYIMRVDGADLYSPKYCPNCGAKVEEMDEF